MYCAAGQCRPLWTWGSWWPGLAPRVGFEAQRLESYSRDVLRNNRKECSDIRSVREQRDGQITVECLSNNKRRELRYEITPTRGNRGARVVLLSEQRNAPHRDGPRRDYR